jgi:hypothetical protein
MQALDIAMTSTSPLIRFEPETSVLRISGESYPENSFEFYEPLMDWLKTAFADLARLRVEINVSYMNSSSTKCVLDMLDLLEEASCNGAAVSVVWRYSPENPRALDLAEEFKEEVTFPFEITPEDA